MEVLIGIRDFFFRVCLCVHARARVCVCVCVYVHGYFLEAADLRRWCFACEWYEGVPLHWGMHPKPRKSVPVTYTRHVHTITYEMMLARVCVCVCMCVSIARAFVLVPVYSSQYYVTPCIEVSDPDVRTERARRLSDDSPTSVYAQRLRTTKIRRTEARVGTHRDCIQPIQPDEHHIFKSLLYFKPWLNHGFKSFFLLSTRSNIIIIDNNMK